MCQMERANGLKFGSAPFCGTDYLCDFGDYFIEPGGTLVPILSNIFTLQMSRLSSRSGRWLTKV